ncbi:MAG: hypothetical protein PHY48_10595 [Candidatus Cloacimonetes bacterium]|nr:hypothetical protein [Candidatus Cloacimonadota bacterium]
MTLVVSWIGVDTHGVSSAYLASDSRISWKTDMPNMLIKYDFARKIYAFKKSADILGYCGDVLYPVMIISQIMEMADNGLLFHPADISEKRSDVILQCIAHHFSKYPRNCALDTIQIIHISRDNLMAKFYCRLISWKKGQWRSEMVPLPNHSHTLLIIGSGREAFIKHYSEFQQAGNSNTSRNVFHSFCYTLANPSDDSYGGSPQLVGIYRKPQSPALSYGIIHNRKRFFLGAKIETLEGIGNLEWRNDKFELCDGITMDKFPEAAKQPYAKF